MKDFRVLKGAEELRFEGNEYGVLLFHGFTGYPGEMEFLARGINKGLGVSVYVPRLPGHGTSKEDFYRTGKRDWLRKALDSYADMAARYKKVAVGGLSMGGILATIVAAVFKVEKALLYAPAHVTTRQKYKFLAYFLSLFVKRKEKGIEISEEDSKDPVRSKLWEEYWKYDHFKQAREFFRLQSYGNHLLEYLESDLLIVVSKKDSVVPARVADFIEKRSRAKVRKILLEKSGHVLVNDVERDWVVEVSNDWLRDWLNS